ncbi:right-handed parallel beta-helix repeat-containing protein [Magnetospira thiophila]
MGDAAAAEPRGLPESGAVFLPAAPTFKPDTRLTRPRLLEVGPSRRYKTPSDAAKIARDGDTVAIDAGTYVGDVAVWKADNLTLVGVGGMARLEADGKSAQGKAIWVIRGNNTTVEHIGFFKATVRDRNGAGIRQEGANLTVRHCLFRDNENGILAGDNPDSDILVEFSEFDHNGFGRGYTHNIYINKVRRFTLRGSYSHRARVGHAVKSRALTTVIAYNRLADGADGNSSYLLDLPNGGTALVMGNEFQQGPKAVNQTAVSFAAERRPNPEQNLMMVNNTLVNQRTRGVFIQNHGTQAAYLANNLFLGSGKILIGPGESRNNLQLAGPGDGVGLDDPTFFTPAEGRNGGVLLGQRAGWSLDPIEEYAHPLHIQTRPRRGRLDVGAHEIE